MVFNKLVLNVIFYILIFIILLDMIFITITLFSKNTKKSSDLFKYYLNNKYFSIFWASFYIIFFILILYGLRVYYINRIIDLKAIYYNAYPIILMFLELPLILIFFIGSMIIFILINMLLIFIIIHKFFTRHIHMLYIYYRYANDKDYSKIKFILSGPYNRDLISHYIHYLSYKITGYIQPDYKYQELPWYHVHKIISKVIYHKYHDKFVSFSPIYIILYDCIFNHFVITHLYKYLIIFIPLMIWRRITHFLHDEATYICELLWNLYYKKETCIYAISPSNKRILEIYLLTDLKSNIDLGLDVEIYLKDSLCYYPDPFEVNGYRNEEGSSLERTSDNKVLKEINTGEDFIKEEWILLVEKFHYKNENKYKTLVYIN